MPDHLSDSTISKIKRLSIVDVARQLGITVKNNKSYCYNGHDKNSLSLSFTPKKGLYKCFGCGDGGDSITLVKKVLKLDFKNACNWLISTFKISCDSFNPSKKIKTKA